MSSSPAPKLPPKRLVTLLAFGFFLFSLLIRLIGIGWGLPKEGQHYSLHPDEDLNLSVSRQIDVAKGKFDPGYYNYGSLYFIVESVASDVVAGYGGAPKQGDRESLFRFNGACILAGRIISAIAGALSVMLLFLIGWRFMSIWGACFGAGALAVAPGFVVHSRFETVDVLATFLLICSFYFALKLLPERAPYTPDLEPADSGEEGGKEGETTVSQEEEPPPATELAPKIVLKATILAGLFAGLSAGTKYTGILAVLALFVVHFMLKRPDRWKMIGLGLVLSMVAFFVTTPGALLNTSKFIQDFKFELLHTSSGHGLIFEGLPTGFVWHLFNLTSGLGMLVCILGTAGCLYAIRLKIRWIWPVLAFGLVYYILIGRAEVLFLRYTFPLMIPLCLGFGLLIGEARTVHRSFWPTLSIVLGIFGLGASLMSTTRMTSWMLGPDPRDQAADYLRAVADKEPTETTVGLVSDPWFYTPTLFPDAAMMRVGFPAYARAMQATSHPKVVRYVPENPDERKNWDIRLITDTQPDYIVFSSFEADDLTRLEKVPNLRPDVQAQVDDFKAFREKLLTTYDQVELFGRTPSEIVNLRPYAIHDLEYIRPYIWIWKKKQPSTTPSSGS